LTCPASPRTSRFAGAGRERGAAARRGQHRPVHHPLPQGAHGRLTRSRIRTIQARVNLLRQLAERKQTILRSIEGQGKLTEELRAAVLAAETPKRLEDLYLPYTPKKRSLATAAAERGLERLALASGRATPASVTSAPSAHHAQPEKELNTPRTSHRVQHISPS